LQKSGTLTLAGALSVDLLPGFTPTTNDAFTVVTAGTRDGVFGNFYFPSNDVTLQLSNTASSVIVGVINVIHRPILLAPALSGSNVLLSWSAISNITYRLEYNSDLGLTNWNGLPGDVTAVSTSASKLDTLTPSNRFYRVRVLP
jgi:hypothetical protein